MILEHRLGVGHLEDRVGDAVLPLGSAVKQVRIHPSRVLGVLGEEMGKVGMVANTILDQFPVPANEKANLCQGFLTSSLRDTLIHMQLANKRRLRGKEIQYMVVHVPERLRF